MPQPAFLAGEKGEKAAKLKTHEQHE